VSLFLDQGVREGGSGTCSSSFLGFWLSFRWVLWVGMGKGFSGGGLVVLTFSFKEF